MDQALKDVLLKHYQRYPEMKIEDYVKLIYQQTFGPAHFSKKADYVHTLSYLIKELNDCKLTYHSLDYVLKQEEDAENQQLSMVSHLKTFIWITC